MFDFCKSMKVTEKIEFADIKEDLLCMFRCAVPAGGYALRYHAPWVVYGTALVKIYNKSGIATIDGI